MKLALDTGGFGKETARRGRDYSNGQRAQNSRDSIQASKQVKTFFPLPWLITSAFGHLSLCVETASGVLQSLQSSTELVAQYVTFGNFPHQVVGVTAVSFYCCLLFHRVDPS